MNTLYLIIGLSLALLLSGGANLYQAQRYKAAVAECEAARVTVERDIATATAAAQKEHADQIAAIAVQSNADEAARTAEFELRAKRIRAAASGYARAAQAAPIAADCRADADRVRAVNELRGYAQ